MIEITISKDEVGLRIAYFCEADDWECKDYLTFNSRLQVWDNKDELLMMTHNVVAKIMSVIDDQYLHEKLVENEEGMDG